MSMKEGENQYQINGFVSEYVHMLNPVATISYP